MSDRYVVLNNKKELLSFSYPNYNPVLWEKAYFCSIDNASIAAYFKTKALQGTDFLYYYAQALIKNEALLEQTLENILKIEELLEEIRVRHICLIKKSNYRLSFNSDGSLKPKEFLNREVFQCAFALSSIMEFQQDCLRSSLIVKEIEQLNNQVDAAFRHYKVNDDTVIAYDKNKTHNIKYLSISRVIDPSWAKSYATYDNLISKKWVQNKNYFTPDTQKLLDENVKYLQEVKIDTVHKTAYAQVLTQGELEYSKLMVNHQNVQSSTDELFSFFNKLSSNQKIFITGDNLNYSHQDPNNQLVYAVIKNGEVQRVIPYNADISMVKEYCDKINVSLEKLRLEQHVKISATSDIKESKKTRFKHKI